MEQSAGDNPTRTCFAKKPEARLSLAAPLNVNTPWIPYPLLSTFFASMAESDDYLPQFCITISVSRSAASVSKTRVPLSTKLVATSSLSSRPRVSMNNALLMLVM